MTLVSHNPNIPLPPLNCGVCNRKMRRSRMQKNRVVCPLSPHFILDWSKTEKRWVESSLPYPV